MAIGIFLVGLVAYGFLPVASMPSVEFPTIRVSASRPGADPAIMAATVAAPLERRLGEIPGVTEITSRSSLGNSTITVQFDLNRSIDGAARDVQAALNAALTDLPGDLPTMPSMRKVNPAAAPIMILALTSKTTPPSELYDVADTVIAQRISQIEGVAEITVNGAEQPAIRVKVDPIAIASMGVSMEDVRGAIAAANATGPLGTFDGPDLARTIGANEQLRDPREYDNIVVKSENGSVVRLGAIATIEQGVRNSRSAAWFNLQPSILLVVTRQADANVIETVDRIRNLLPELKRWIPADVEISVLSDRTQTIRASVLDLQLTLVATIILVMLVVFLFLRRTAATIAAGVTVPLSLAGTCAAMWLAGFSINNLSLMALVVSVGFVVDDAIVVIENVFRNLEKGMTPLRAAIEGTRQIGFTVISITVSLVAAFIPLLFMGGLVGRLFWEFSLTLTFAVTISMFVALTITPMICAHFVRQGPSPDATWLDRLVERILSRAVAAYAASLAVVLRHKFLTLLVFVATAATTVHLYVQTPKGFFPQDDTGLIFGGTRASPEISFEAMKELQQRATQIVLSDPAVAYVGSSVGASTFNASVNRGRLFISLKPRSERGGVTSQQVINRLRPKLLDVGGMRVFMFPAQDVRAGGRQSDSSYQFTLWNPDLNELLRLAPIVVNKVQTLPELVDVTTDREQNGLQVNVTVDRRAAARLGVRIQDIDNALNNSFAQRQVSTIYSARNQYRVILEIDPQFQRDPADLSRVYVPGAGGAMVPLQQRGQGRAGAGAAGHQPSGVVPGGDDHLQSRAGRHARTGVRRHRPGGGGTAPAGFAAHRVRRRCAGREARAQHAAAGHSRGAAHDLHRAGRAVRKPRAPADDHLHAAVGRSRRAARAHDVQRAADGDRVYRHHSADRHCEEERHHDGGLRACGRAPAGSAAAAGDPGRLHRALPPDHDDDAFRHARRGAADRRDRPRRGAAPAARHDHHRRASGVAGADALHHARDLSSSRFAAPPAVGQARPARGGRGNQSADARRAIGPFRAFCANC
jgi:multidrug efflux pump subunit AcrB